MREAKEVEVSFTAKVMAAIRAIETHRPGALFIDPFAELLAGADAIEAARPGVEAYAQQGRPFVSVRTRFFDDFLMAHSHNTRQVVLLGAGLDTRAFRLNWEAGTRVYEIDCSEVLHYKEAILAAIQPQCHRYSICANLTDFHWSQLLLERGYQPSERSIWLCEGLLYYLNSTDVDQLLTTIQNLTIAESWFGADMNNSVVVNGSADWAKYWQFSCDHPESFLANYGWKASVLQPGEAGASFGRFTYRFPDRSVPDAPHTFFVTACKQD